MLISLLLTLLGFYLLVQLGKQLIEKLFPMDLQGKTVVVIGATTGFGHQFVLKCAREGMTVFAACNSPNGVQKVKDATFQLPGIVHAHQIDLCSSDSVERFFRFVAEKLPSGAGLHALVNNAGIIRAGSDDWLAVEDYEHVLRVNLFGLIRVTKLFKEHLKLARGRIVFCSSICGRLAFPLYGPYTVSKFAMEGYCDTIRRELAPFGVRVAVVEPGYFRTPITSPEHIPAEMERSFHAAPAHIREQYGEHFVKKVRTLAREHLASAANSPHVEWVVDVYFHACTALFPRKRYVVGIDANFVVVPIARLPAELQDFAFWLHALLLGVPLPKALLQSNGGGRRRFLNAKMLPSAKWTETRTMRAVVGNGVDSLLRQQQQQIFCCAATATNCCHFERQQQQMGIKTEETTTILGAEQQKRERKSSKCFSPVAWEFQNYSNKQQQHNQLVHVHV